jgi:hypothetical protein
MKTKTKKILVFLQVLAWLGVFGYAFNLGSQLISFGVSFWNPVASKQILGIPQNLLELYNYNFQYYVFVMSFVICMSAMFLYLWYTVVILLLKLNIKSPFTVEVSQKLQRIAYCLLAIWVVGFIGEQYVDWVAKHMGTALNIIKVENEFLFTSGIVYIISQIFKYGIEIQEENQQTI